MAGRLRAQIADLAAHPDRADALLQQPPDLRSQIADGQNLPRLLRREQFAEIPLRFGLFAHQNFNSIKPQIEY
jgi:hypothetical protein